MFEKLKSIFKTSPKEPEQDIDQLPLAISALLVEAARADQDYTQTEQAIIDHALSSLFSMSPTEATALRAQGEEAQKDAADLHRFTKSAKTLPIEDKKRFMEEMWRIALSDGERNAYEETLIRRLCGLIHISDVESAEARQRVAAQL